MSPKPGMFASLKLYNYRVFAIGALVSNVGGWMATIAQDWLVLTHLTDGSSSALGVVTGLQFLPFALFAPFTGALADRFDKRKMLILTQVLMALNTVALFGLVATGVVQLWHVYLIAAIQGSIQAFDNPARQAFVSEMVPTSLLPNAVGLNSVSFNGARLIGPGIAGVVIGLWGVAPALAINTLSFAGVIGGLLLIRPADLNPAPPRKGGGAVREGFAYVRNRGDIMLVMAIVFVLGTFGMNFQITNALMATQVFGKGATEYGALGSIMAIGTLAAGLFAARRGRPRLRLLLGALGGFAFFCTLAAFAPTYGTFALLLVPIGLCALTVMITANSTVQLSTEPQFRGRVMSLYTAIFLGGTPIGAPIIGWVGDVLGPRWTLLIGAIACGAMFVGVGLFLVLHEGLRVRLQKGWPLRLQVWQVNLPVETEIPTPALDQPAIVDAPAASEGAGQVRPPSVRRARGDRAPGRRQQRERCGAATPARSVECG